jgi:PhnB protein
LTTDYAVSSLSQKCRKALGAEVQMMMRYKESPEPPQPSMVQPDWGDKIMHASFKIGETTLLASDGCHQKQANFQSVSLAITPPNEADAKKMFNALADGGQVRMPLTKTFFSPCFGMLADRFGVGWMIMVRA